MPFLEGFGPEVYVAYTRSKFGKTIEASATLSLELAQIWIILTESTYYNLDNCSGGSDCFLKFSMCCTVI